MNIFLLKKNAILGISFLDKNSKKIDLSFLLVFEHSIELKMVGFNI